MLGQKIRVLSEKHLTLTKSRLRWLILLSSIPLFGMVAAFGIAPNTSFEELPVEQVVLRLEVPEVSPAADPDMTFWRQERIERGDTTRDVAVPSRRQQSGSGKFSARRKGCQAHAPAHFRQDYPCPDHGGRRAAGVAVLSGRQ